MLQHVWILGGFRTCIGVKDKQYRRVPAETLGAAVLRKTAGTYCPDPSAVDLICGGNACAGGGNITRLAALLAGLPESVPCVTSDLQCASALDCITSAAARIEAGLADLVLAGGLESASTQPLREWNPNHPACPEDPDRRRYMTARFTPGPYSEQAMLLGAERTAAAEHISRKEADFYALRSHQLAADAAARGILRDLLVDPLSDPAYPACSLSGDAASGRGAGSGGTGSGSACHRAARDEGIRPGISQRFLDRLPCLLPGGAFLTAGNSCLMNDGAAFLVLCSDRYARAHGLHPEFLFRCAAAAGSDPDMSPQTAVLAAQKLLRTADLSPDRISAFEVNEAFAVIDVLFQRAFPGTLDRCSIYGGALAYGHPYGASGGILALHLMRALQERDGRFGLASIAAAGGIGEAVLIERC